MALTKTPELFSHFEDMEDPRVERTRLHSLHEMIVVALCAAICGAEGWADVERFGNTKIDWFRRFLDLENGIASHDTFGRVFSLLDTEQFHGCVQSWIDSLQLAMEGQGVHIDGKTMRRSFDKGSGTSALHMVSAWAGDLRVCLGQVAVDDKSNEIPAVRKLLDLLELTGAVVTVDAMHCQKKTAAKILDRGADYILTVKNNQPKLYDQLMDLFITYGENGYRDRRIRRLVTKERNRGRDEEREYIVAPAPPDLKAKWPGLKSVGMIYRRVCKDGVETNEIVFIISSLPPKVRVLAKQVRNHWSVENSLHWVLDVTFSEDASRIRKGTGPEIAGVFRRLALSILQRDTTLKESIRGKRLRAGWSNQELAGILSANKA
jgi:predicted transposase YbfD/YdcC